MRALLLAAIAAATAVTLASTAPAYAAPPTPVYNWTGFYIGGHAGCGWLRQTINRITVEDDEPADAAFVHIKTKGDRCFGGGQIGYNYQYPNNVVLGIEADASWGSLKGSGKAPEGDEELIPFHHRLKSFGTVRGRVGYANGQFLPYITGGWAWGRNELTVNAVDDGLITHDRRTHGGWTVGGGLEYIMNPNWTVKLEYLYLHLGEKTYSDVAFFDAAFPGADLELKIHTVKLGLNYKFNW